MSEAAPVGGRIAGLDAARALLMIGGLFVHAAACLPTTALTTVIADLSHAFRMGAFFAISGFLTALVLAKRDPILWLKERVIRLGVPAVFGLALLAPLMSYLALFAPGPHEVAPYSFKLYHMWFLLALIGYSAIYVLLVQLCDKPERLLHAPSHLPDGCAGRLAMLTTAVSAALLFAAARTAAQLWLPGDAVVNCANIVGHLPFFLFGAALARFAWLRADVLACGRIAAMLCVGASIALVAASAGVLGHEPAMYVGLLTEATAPVAASVVILGAALHVRTVTTLVQRIADASYTIYMLHFPIAVGVNATLGATMQPVPAYLTCVMIAGLSSYAIHRLVVRRVPALMFLLNGRLPRPAPGEVQWTKRATTSR